LILPAIQADGTPFPLKITRVFHHRGRRVTCYTSGLSSLSRAAQWWLHSGIQTPSGGVARYYRSDLHKNQAISTEITGYAVSNFVYLHSLTGDRCFLERARTAASFLISAWNAGESALPFELAPGSPTYFFDCGIVVRGLLAAWRITGENSFLQSAVSIGNAMHLDFRAPDGSWHPILELPGKAARERDSASWSQSAGCYQLKSAMAWHDLSVATGEEKFQTAYEQAVQAALQTHRQFLPGHPDQSKVMDRLHAYSYFLEGLLPVADQPDCTTAIGEGISRVAALLRQIAPEFERSDVYAQLLRVRIYADRAGAAPIDRQAAAWEAEQLAAFQADAHDARVAGGFYFGRRQGDWLPYVNPVSTAFATQALALWDHFQQTGVENGPGIDLLI
jgi:hypothetical protein